MKRSYYLIRIIPCGLVVVACLCISIMSMKITGYTDLQRMRLAEKANMVGPSTLLGQEENLPIWGNVMIGRTDYGYTLFCSDSEELFYQKSGEDFAVFTPIYHHFYDSYNDKTFTGTIPVILFVHEENATQAKLTVIAGNTNSGCYYEVPFTEETNINENGYFLFRLSLGDHNYLHYIEDVTKLLNQQDLFILSYGTVTLELFDDDGNMIVTHTREVPIRQPLT